jgi:hypothetical protein
MEYEDTEWTSKYNGAELPTMPGLDLRGFYDGRVSEWANVKLERYRCSFVLPSGKRLLFQTVLRELRKTGDPVRAIAPYVTVPNGQVKNFLNACAATVPAKGDVIRVLVVGSKSGESSGLWHRMFAIWLSGRYKLVVIDFYDPAELAGSWSANFGDSNVTCEWIASKVDLESLEPGQYDVLVDDVWSLEGASLPYPQVFLDSLQSYSLKKILNEEDLKGLRPGSLFLHRNETRVFVPERKKVFLPGCSCLTCDVIKSCVLDYESYIVLRSMAGRLGYSAPCEGISHLHELAIIADLHKRLRAGLKVEGSNLARYLTSLTEEIGIVQEGQGHDSTYHHSSEPRYQVFTRFDAKEKKLPSYPFLEGKEVAFLGVPSSVVGRTVLKSSHYDFEHGNVFFVNSIETWKLLGAAETVFTSSAPELVAREFPGWVMTGNKVGSYKEWRRRPVILTPSTIVQPAEVLSLSSLKVKVNVGRGEWSGLFDVSVIKSPYVLVGSDGKRVLMLENRTWPDGNWRVVCSVGEFEICPEGVLNLEGLSKRIEMILLETHKPKKKGKIQDIFVGTRKSWKVLSFIDPGGTLIRQLPLRGSTFFIEASCLEWKQCWTDVKKKNNVKASLLGCWEEEIGARPIPPTH